MFFSLHTLVFLTVSSSLAFHLPQNDFVPYILNGQDADEGEWPHQVILLHVATFQVTP